ncbi:MAG: hypothetical protein JNL74_22880 [Fibrobacteres bacterium]|nr:hypothetical protein [Fibrobacterota bacterium]
MTFEIRITSTAEEQLLALKKDRSLTKRYKAVSKAIRLLVSNPRHPGLQTHKYDSLQGENGEEIFEAYAEQNTPAAYRIFWHYGPNKRQITIIAITPHP